MTLDPTPPPHPNAEHGFTLIEVIVGLALLALTAAMLAGIVTGSRQVFKQLANNEAVNSVVPVQTYLRAALEHTAAVTEQGGGAPVMPAGMTGWPDRLVFSTTYSQHGQFEGVYRVELSLRNHPGTPAGFDLVVTEALLRPLALAATDTPALPRQTVVLTNVTGLQITYFGKTDAEEVRWEWFRAWEPAARLPAMVRINIGFAPNDPRSWQTLDIRLNVAN